MAKIKLSGNEHIDLSKEKAKKLMELKQQEQKPNFMVDIGNRFVELRNIKEIDLGNKESKVYTKRDLELNIYSRALSVYKCRKDSNYSDCENWKPEFINGSAVVLKGLREEFTRDFRRTIEYQGAELNLNT